MKKVHFGRVDRILAYSLISSYSLSRSTAREVTHVWSVIQDIRCSESMQKIYRKTPMPKYDFSKVALELY